MTTCISDLLSAVHWLLGDFRMQHLL